MFKKVISKKLGEYHEWTSVTTIKGWTFIVGGNMMEPNNEYFIILNGMTEDNVTKAARIFFNRAEYLITDDTSIPNWFLNDKEINKLIDILKEYNEDNEIEINYCELYYNLMYEKYHKQYIFITDEMPNYKELSNSKIVNSYDLYEKEGISKKLHENDLVNKLIGVYNDKFRVIGVINDHKCMYLKIIDEESYKKDKLRIARISLKNPEYIICPPSCSNDVWIFNDREKEILNKIVKNSSLAASYELPDYTKLPNK